MNDRKPQIWVLRAEHERDELIRSLRGGKVRLGWSSRTGQDLRKIQRKVSEGKRLTDDQKRSWKGGARLFLEQVQENDFIIVRPEKSPWFWFAVAQAKKGNYDYDQGLLPDRDFKSYRPCELLYVWDGAVEMPHALYERLAGRRAARQRFSGVKRASEKRAFEQFLRKARRTIAPAELDSKDITKSLRGRMAPREACQTARRILEVKGRCEWYAQHGYELSEEEMRTFLVVPFLEAFGWTYKHVKTEWNNIDVATFQQGHELEQEPVLIVEVKKIGRNLEKAYGQAKKNYAREYPYCKDILISDGEKFVLYRKQNGKWPSDPNGYLNLRTLWKANPIEPTAGGPIRLISRLADLAGQRE